MSHPGSVKRYPFRPAGAGVKGTEDLLTILFKHRSMMSVIFLATVLAATIWSFLIPPAYEARSILM